MKKNLQGFILFLLLSAAVRHKYFFNFIGNRWFTSCLLLFNFLTLTESVSAQCFSNPPDNTTTTVFYTCSGGLSFSLSSKSGNSAPLGEGQPNYGACSTSGPRSDNAQWVITKATDNGNIRVTTTLTTGGINVWIWGGFTSMPTDCSKLTTLNTCGQYDHDDAINFTVEKDKYYVILLTGMTGAGTSFSISGTGPAVIPPPTVMSQSRCGSGPVTLTASGALAGQTYNWYDSNGILVHSSTNPQFVTPALSASTQYTVKTSVTTNTGASCESDPTTVTVTINNLPAITVQPTSASVCQGSNVTLTATANGSSDLTYQWRKDGATIAGATAATYTISNATSSASGSYDVIVSNSCGSVTSNAAVVTVNPVPILSVPAAISVCPGASIAATTFTSSPAGATFTWTNSNPAIGLAASGNGQVPSFTATNNSASAISATITVTPALNGCIGAPVSYTITVKPLATVTVPSAITVCAGAVVPSSNFISNPAGADFAWASSNTAIGLSETSGTGNVHSFTATNNTTAPITSTITVTPNINGCTGTPKTYTITVNPLPVITAIPTPTSSCGQNDGKITVSATVLGPFEYSIDGGNSFPSTNGIFEELSSGSYLPAVRNSAGCITVGETVSISSPDAPAAPTVTPGNDSACEGSSVTFNIVSPISGATYTWTGPMGFNQSGLDPFLTITGITSLEAGEYAVTATVSGCVSPASTFDIFVKPLPVATVPSSMTVCSGTAIAGTSFTSTPDGANFTWSVDNANIGLSSPGGSGNVPPFTATNTTGSVQVGTITVTPTLNDCVGPSVSYSITVNPLPTATISGDATICYGGSTNLSVALTGTAPYTLTYTDGSTPVTVAGINSSTYTFPVSPASTKTYTVTSVSDANSCTNSGSGSATVNTPSAPLSASVLKTNVTCYGSSTGSISYTISGGTAPYTVIYSYNSGTLTGSFPLTTNSGTATGLPAGTYDITVTDANNCTPIVQTIIITQPSAPLAGTAASTNITCAGQTDGTITISPSGGYGTYDYTINGGTSWQSSNLFTGLASGIYNVQVRDAAQPTCVFAINTSLAITQPAPLTATASQTNVTCFGQANGTITVNASGGYGSYQFSVDGGITWQSANIFTGLTPQTYSIQIRDALHPACTTVINNLVIIQPSAAVTGTATSTNVTCFGSNDGTITITASGGYGNYEYSIDGGLTWQTSNAFTAVMPGSYHVQVRDSDQNTCVAEVEASLTISQPAEAVAGTAIFTNVSCFGLNDGTITITATGGYGTYEFSIDGGSVWQSANTFTGLAAQSYQVMVRDKAQPTCVASVNLSLTILAPAGPVSGTATSVNINCFGSTDGKITINASGGYGTYEYSIDGGLNWQTNNSFTGLSARTYNNILVRDLEQPACIGTVNPVTITEPADLTLDGSYSPILCYGGTTTVTLIANGGTGALEYRLGTGAYQNSNTITGVSAGTHQFWVRDVNGCEQDYMVTISQPAQLNLTAGASPIQCDGSSTVTLTAGGGTGNYQFRNGSGAYQASNTFNVGQGSYTFYVSDGACEESVVVNIAGQSSLTLTGSFTAIACFGGSSTVTLAANGGNGGYSFKADNGAWQTGNTFTLTSGDHIFAVSDAGGCQQFFQVNIPQPDKLNAVLTKIKDASCYGTSTGSVSLSITGNRGTANITWFKDGQAIAAPSDLNALSAGAYSVQITDACSSVTSNQVIIEPSPLTVVLRKLRDADCTGANTGALELQITGGEGTVTQAWTKDGAAISTPSSLSALSAGTYRVTVQDNCSSVQSENIIIDPAALQVDFYKINDVQCNGNADGGIGLRVYNSTGTTTVSWFKNDTAISTPADLRQLPAGSYHVRVTDFCSSIITPKITVTEPDALSVSILSKKDVSCFGGADGSATLTITGGKGPYRYLWSNSSTNKDLNGVSTGIYTVTVTDLNNCSASQSVTITEPADLTLDGSYSPILCYGGTTTVTLIANGGTGALEYRLGTGAYQNSNTITGVSAGTHQFWVRDVNGCEQDYMVTISQPARLNLTAGASPIQCDGSSTVTLTADGGTENYQFRNGSGAYQASNTFNVGQGSYTFYVSDGACEESVVVNIAGQSSLTLTGSFTAIACFGGSSTVTLTANGGNGGYSFKADNGAWQTENTFTLTSGDHIFAVSDAGGCQQFFQMNIPQPDPLNAVLTKIKDASCYGTSTGSVSLSITGNQGTANITWFKDGQAIAAPSDLNALSAGAYSVQITDACSSVTSNQVIIEPSPLIVVLRKLRDADCTGANTGALEMQITGGEGTVTQAWTKDGAAISTPSSLSALSAGTYRVTVQDNCSSVQSENIIIDPAALQVDFYKINDVQCNGNADGGIGLRVYNSIGTTTVSWFKNNIAVQPPPDLRKLAGGTYYVRIKDYCSEVITEKITISEPAGLITNIQIKQQISCYGGADGSAEAVTTGGTAPYRYLWSNDSKGEVLSSVSAGKYTVTVTDFNNCQVSQSVTLTQPSAPLTASFTKTDVGCFGGATGTATVTVTGGTAPYLYKWSTDAETKTISSLSAGDYRLTITDFAGCTLTENVTISQPAAPLAITFTKKDVACFGEKNGSVDITVTGGTAPYKYRWSNAEESEDINNLAPGSYTITVIDKNGCVIRQTVDIIEPAAPLKASLTVKHAICKTSNDGVITANVTGGTQPYSYQWKGLSSSTNEIDNLAPKTYELLVTDFKGCTFTVSAEVLAGNCPPVAVNDRFTTDEQVPVSGSAAINDFDRQNEVLKFNMTSSVKNGIINFSDDGRFTYTPNQGFWGTETFSYRICNTSGLCDDASVAIDVIPYTIVNLTPAIVNVREGKKTTVTATLMRPFKDDVLITIAYAGDASKDRDYVLLDQFQTIRIPAGATTTTQKITIAALTDELEENDESIIMRISATSDPLVRVGTGSVVIISDIYPSDTLPGTPVSTEIPPNPDISPDPLVSPNADGQGNEFFRINNIVSFPDNEVVIFNRWGNEVFRVKSYNESDRVFTGLANTGMVINADSKLPDGVYYYLITTNRISGGKNIRALNKGYLILKR